MSALRSRPELTRAALLVLLAFVLYNANLRVVASGDSRATRFVPLALLRSGTLALDDFRLHVTGFFKNAYWAREIDGRLVSMYPVVTPLLATPFYVPAAVYLQRAGWQDRPLAFAAALSEKLAASILTAVSVGLLYLLLRRRAPRGDALLLTLACAFGTNTWATSSQALWQHGASQLLLAAALLAATGERTTGRLAIAGVCCGLLAANRPPDALLAVAVAAYLVLDLPEKRRLAAFLLPAAAAGLAFAAYNVAVFGHPLGGYPLLMRATFFDHSAFAGLAGLFLSPAKGLFVFSPFLLFLLARPFVPGAPEDRRLNLCLAAGAAALLFVLARADWRGGFCYGPRFLTDLLPIFLWMLVPVLARMGRGLRIAFVAAVLLSIPQQVIGVLYYPFGRSDMVLAEDVADSWKIENAQFLLELRNSPPLWGGRQDPRK
ncbi:MAG TPA: hypothetical protein VKM72_35305 [Thermoanaerobaculia bacterium]|nr:hypothetical protein [Thermoanaerobaculia bacterium]